MRRTFLTITAALAVATAPLSESKSAFAQAEAVPVLVAETAMNGVIDNLRKSIQDLLDRLDQTVSSGTFLARMQLQYLLAEVDYRAGKVIDKTFNRLDEQQQVFFRNTRQTLFDLEKLGSNLTTQADTVTQRVELLIGNTVLGTNEPRLRAHFPRVVTASAVRQTQSVTFDGSWLANGKPTLSFGEKTCTLSDLKEPKAVFSCPTGTLLEEPAGIAITSGMLRVVDDPGWLSWLWSLIGGDVGTKDYPVSIAVVPDKFAHVKVTATHLVESPQSAARSQAFDTGAEHCVWGRSTLVNISPAGPGWAIDVNSIAVHVNSSNDGRHELRNITNAGFQLYAEGRNHGSCRRVLGEYVYRDARGWHNGTVNWTETKTIETPIETGVFDDALKWGDSRVMKLPAKTQSFTARFDLFDGKAREYNAVVRDPFVTIERDDAGSALKVAPHDIQTAFR